MFETASNDYTPESPANVKPHSTGTNNTNRLDFVLTRIRQEIRSAVKRSPLAMVRTRFDTSDVIQESMLQIWQQLKDHEIEKLEFTRGLLSFVAKGHARKLMRFHSAKRRTIFRQQAQSGSFTSREPDPVDQSAVREEVGLMLEALNFVHPIRQLILFRRFFDDASYKEIGDELLRPIEWVRQQCLRAQREIRTILNHFSG